MTTQQQLVDSTHGDEDGRRYWAAAPSAVVSLDLSIPAFGACRRLPLVQARVGRRRPPLAPGSLAPDCWRAPRVTSPEGARAAACGLYPVPSTAASGRRRWGSACTLYPRRVCVPPPPSHLPRG